MAEPMNGELDALRERLSASRNHLDVVRDYSRALRCLMMPTTPLRELEELAARASRVLDTYLSRKKAGQR
jgi:hypothetical protein